jgi:hypothetical protein
MPEFVDGSQELEISTGRHPVVEMVLKQESLGWPGHMLLFLMIACCPQVRSRSP